MNERLHGESEVPGEDAPVEGPSFAEAFGDALHQRALSLASLHEFLEGHGVRLSVATLSYWRSGARKPDPVRSLDAIVAIEHVLDLLPGQLSQYVTGRSRRLGTVSTPRAIGDDGTGTSDLFHRLGASPVENTRMLSVQETVVIGESSAIEKVSTVLLLQCVQDTVDTLAFVAASPAPTDAEPRLHLVSGGSLWRRERHANGITFGFAVRLDRRLSIGETAMLAFEVTFPESYPPQHSFQTSVRRPVREVIHWFRFSEQNPPQWFEEEEQTEERRRKSFQSPRAPGSLHRVRHNFGPGSVTMTWGVD